MRLAIGVIAEAAIDVSTSIGEPALSEDKPISQAFRQRQIDNFKESQTNYGATKKSDEISFVDYGQTETRFGKNFAS